MREKEERNAAIYLQAKEKKMVYGEMKISKLRILSELEKSIVTTSPPTVI